jgi:hypothetical protein
LEGEKMAKKLFQRLFKRNKTSLERQVKTCDWLVFGALVFILAVRFFTIALIFEISETTGETVERIAQAFEANPIMELLFKLKSIGVIIITLLIPGAAYATYMLLRKRVLNKKMQPDTLYYYSNLIFFIMLFNFVNDLAYYVGRLL